MTIWPRKHKRKTPSQAFTRSKQINRIGRSLKFCGTVHILNWIDSFLGNRKQCVIVNGEKSDLWSFIQCSFRRTPRSGTRTDIIPGPHNDISENITSNIRVFADDCLCYREIDSLEDCDILQQDINKLSNWAQAWGMRFQHVKCNMMTLSRKNYSIRFQYTLLDTPLEFFQSIKYLGVHISNNLTWNKHIEETCNKA